jgi:hypothetical protein
VYFYFRIKRSFPGLCGVMQNIQRPNEKTILSGCCKIILKRAHI